MASKGGEFIRSLQRVAPQAVLEPDEGPDEWAQVLAAIERAATPPVLPVIPAPYVDVEAPDLTPLLEAVNAARMDPQVLAVAIGAVVAAALAERPDTAAALDAVVKELAALRKKFSGVVSGGGGGGPSEVGLRVLGVPVDAANPLPVVVEGTISLGEVEVKNDVGNPVPVSLPGLAGLVFGQTTVTTSETAVPAAGAKAGRATISVKALAANGAEIYIRHVTGATTLNSWELSAGDSIDIDAKDTETVFAVSASGSQKLCTAEL